MRQLFTFLLLVPAAAGLFIFTFNCNTGSKCRELTGHWTTRDGQDLVFLPGGKALWLTKFGSQFDTNQLEYKVECSNNVVLLDLTNFQSGPNIGKTLYGILDWSTDTSFRLRYETGSQPDVRPAEFDNEQTIKFILEKEGK